MSQFFASGGQSPGGEVVKNRPAKVGDKRDTGSIPGLARSPGEGNGNPLPYSCLGNSMDRGAWQATVHGAAKSQTRLTTHTHTLGCSFPCMVLPLLICATLRQSMAQSCLFILSPVYGLSVCVPLKPVGGAVVKNLPANAGDARDEVLTPGSGRLPGEGNGNPLQYSCWEIP